MSHTRIPCKGVPHEELTLGYCAIFDYVDAYAEYRRARSQANVHSIGFLGVLKQFRSFVRPIFGPIWLAAPYYSKDAALLVRCRDFLTANRGDIALDGLPPEAIFQAACTATHKALDGSLVALRVDPATGYSRDPLTNIQLVLDFLDRPIEAYEEMLATAARSLPKHVQSTRDALAIRDHLLMEIRRWRPLRLDTLAQFQDRHLFNEICVRWMTDVPKAMFKNARSLSCRPLVGKVPPYLHPILDLYWNEARPWLAKEKPSSAFFLSLNGDPLDQVTMEGIVYAYARKFAPYLFPTGLNPHAVRHLVASTFIREFGHDGVSLAAVALNVSERTITETYGHLIPGEHDRRVDAALFRPSNGSEFSM